MEARSAGFIESEGRVTPPDYQGFARSHGVDLADHGSRWVGPELVEWADLIVLMDRNNREDFDRLYPEAADRTVALGRFLDPPVEEIEDPYLVDERRAREVYGQMARAVEGLREGLLRE